MAAVTKSQDEPRRAGDVQTRLGKPAPLKSGKEFDESAFKMKAYIALGDETAAAEMER